MINWVEVVRRLLALYKVRTMVELGMAMGIPVNMDAVADVEHTGLGWKILEIAVHDKKVSWDWLLTGDGTPPEGYAPHDAPPSPKQEAEGEKKEAKAGKDPSGASGKDQREMASLHPRIETRELMRTLLGPDESGRLPRPGGHDARVAEELEEIKSTMQREIDKVDELLEEEGS